MCVCYQCSDGLSLAWARQGAAEGGGYQLLCSVQTLTALVLDVLQQLQDKSQTVRTGLT